MHLQSQPFSGSPPEIGVFPEVHKHSLSPVNSPVTLQMMFIAVQGSTLHGSKI